MCFLFKFSRTLSCSALIDNVLRYIAEQIVEKKECCWGLLDSFWVAFIFFRFLAMNFLMHTMSLLTCKALIRLQ